MFTSSPTHPDYAQIMQAVSEADDQVLGMDRPRDRGELEAQLRTVHEGLVDTESLFAASRTRAALLLHDVPPLQFVIDPVAALAALYADAFLTGVRFQKAGGTTAS